MADLAVEVAIYLESGKYGSSIVEDSRALAWAYLANAFRITSDLWKAEQALYQACLHHGQDGGDTFTEAEILGFAASLRTDQGRFQEALRLCDSRLAIYSEAHDRHLAGAAMIHKGMILGESGQTEQAISVIRGGLNRIDPEREPRLLFSGNHNLITFTVLGGAVHEAQRLLEHQRRAYTGLARIDLARIRWVEGMIYCHLERWVEAEDALREVRDFFLELDLGVEVFVTSLDLAQLFARRGRRQQVRDTLGEMIPLGEALGLRRETMAARLLYEQASRA